MGNTKIKRIIAIVGVIVLLLVILYVAALMTLNSLTAKKIDFNSQKNCRWQQEGDIYFVAGTASIIDPKVHLIAVHYNEETDMEISIDVFINVFWQKEMTMEFYQNDEVIAYMYIEEDGSYTHYDTSDLEFCEASDKAWEEYQEEIQMVLEVADKKWNILD